MDNKPLIYTILILMFILSVASTLYHIDIQRQERQGLPTCDEGQDPWEHGELVCLKEMKCPTGPYSCTYEDVNEKHQKVLNLTFQAN